MAATRPTDALCTARKPATRLAVRLFVLIVALAVPACASTGRPDPAAGPRVTALAQTAAALLTKAAAITPTASRLPPSPTPTLTPRPTLTPTLATPSATPTVTPTPCTNGSEFLLDLSVPDGTHFAPGTRFVKTWRLRNSGTCTWTTDYEFRHVEGDAMRGQPLKLPAEVRPGERIDLSLALIAPATAGSYRGRWQLHTPHGEGFGIRPYVDIVVP